MSDVDLNKMQDQTTPDVGISPSDVKKWLSRAKVANRWLTGEIMPKYVTAKKRYNSECGYTKRKGKASLIASHRDVNLLYKVIRDFIGSIFFKNPEIDLIARDQDDEEAVRKVENLEQKVNDDIRDNDEFKRLIRSVLVDEGLAGFGAVYEDFVYTDQDAIGEDGNPILLDGVFNDDGTPAIKRANQANEVKYCKIRPECLIVPPYIQQYNYKTAPYIGYYDIVSLDKLKNDNSLDQSVVATLKGSEYKDLIDREYDKKEVEDKQGGSDILHVKCYYLFIRSEDGSPLKRLVIADEANETGEGGKALFYGDWDKGHKHTPIHILMLNDSADGFLPPSEAWILESVLIILDYLFDKMNRHLRKSTTKTLFLEGEGGIKKDIMDKFVKNFDQELIGIKGLPPGTDLRQLVHQIQDIALSNDHLTMYEMAKAAFDQLSRQPSFSKQSVVEKKKTATETEEIAADDSTENGDYIDKFRDFLKDLAYDHASLIQRNFVGTTSITVTDEDTGEKEERPDVDKEDFSGEFRVDIQVSSFQPQSKAKNRLMVQQTLSELSLLKPLLDEQGMTINAPRLTRWWTQNVDVRDSEDLIQPKDDVRSVDQQLNDFVFTSKPFNPDGVAGDRSLAIQRALSLFGDERVMQTYETLYPGISGDQSPFIEFIRGLEASLGAQNAVQPKAS